ncbi:T9SS type A sorting domain-containing protein [Moheibacter sediminis]|uniref:Por secretion system C-terminal sorting domain-containing protein n=1 Tax=Moheibacter sediminis TaxID=1434700 RepID=A0A1W1YC14_9FLAO|nr:T9SS type A sorting domain-containing protein [Moheibacter sediminis]SMC33712.1 Por secretion system C-terminal sorting domain-containing protein [Moheibacter sediminis]
MRKKLSVYSIILFSGLVTGQEAKISFESEEGYTLAALGGQFNWQTWGETSGDQTVVTALKASDGLQSVKINSNESVKDDYGVESTIPFYEKSEITFDINVEEIGGSDNWVVIYNSDYEMIAGVDFNAIGNVEIYDQGDFDFVSTSSIFVNDQWYKVKIELDFTSHTVNYYLDNSLIHSAAIDSSITRYDILDFRTDDFGTSFYVDNINIKNLESMTASDITKQNNIKIYPNPVADILYVESDKSIKSFKLYDTAGGLIKSQSANRKLTKLDIRSLNKGIYILKLETANGIESKEIIKK